MELQKLSARLLQIQDEERRRLARELHDDLGQQLAAIKMMLAKVSGSEQVREMTDAAVSTVRNLSYLLHPPLLDETGLRAALHWYIDGLAKRSGIKDCPDDHTAHISSSLDRYRNNHLPRGSGVAYQCVPACKR